MRTGIVPVGPAEVIVDAILPVLRCWCVDRCSRTVVCGTDDADKNISKSECDRVAGGMDQISMHTVQEDTSVHRCLWVERVGDIVHLYRAYDGQQMYQEMVLSTKSRRTSNPSKLWPSTEDKAIHRTSVGIS